MLNPWTFGGLSLAELIRRTARESWEDSVFGQGGRMAFYHFLAIFPALLVLLTISARIPHLGEHMKNVLQDLSSQVLPDQVSLLFQKMTDELSAHTLSSGQFLIVCAGAVWAALNGTWAMIYGLNRAYEVQEGRSLGRLALTIAGLTVALTVAGSAAVFLIFCSARLHLDAIGVRILEWLVLTALLALSFAVLYRFAPNLSHHDWRWITPGALCAVILWIGTSLAARVYFDHIDDYSRSYGHLNGVVMYLLWLYVTNGAILIGGEMNSEIEKAVANRHGAKQDPSG